MRKQHWNEAYSSNNNKGWAKTIETTETNRYLRQLSEMAKQSTKKCQKQVVVIQNIETGSASSAPRHDQSTCMYYYHSACMY